MNSYSSVTPLPVNPPPRPAPTANTPGLMVAGFGPPVVMLHASLSSKAQWNVLASRLGPRYQTIGIDLCGYGDNALPADRFAFTLDDEVRLVAAHLDRIAPADRRVHLVGHSYGGAVALRYAQSHASRVASLTLYEPVAFKMLEGDDAALADIRHIADSVLRLLAAGRRHDAARVFVDFWNGAGAYAAMGASTQGSLARSIEKVPFDFQAARFSPSTGFDLRHVAVPTLLLAGHRSPSVVQHITALLVRALPDQRVRWFDTGHMGPLTDPHLINPWIEAFIDTCVKNGDAPTPNDRLAECFDEPYAA
jgi:pimeloyl-ACP methyl ester carboxylesterase